MFWKKKGPVEISEISKKFQAAEEENDIDKMKELARFNIDPDILGSALVGCCYSGNMDLAFYLIDNGANINVESTRYGWISPLNASSKEGCTKLAIALCQKGANPNFVDRDHCTPLFYACSRDDVKLVEELIKAGANLETRCYNKETALLRSSWSASLECVKLLVKAGARTRVKDADRKSPLELAKGNHRTEIIEYLQSI